MAQGNSVHMAWGHNGTGHVQGTYDTGEQGTHGTGGGNWLLINSRQVELQEFCSNIQQMCLINISPNKVFGDIIVLASPPPVDPDEVNALTSKIFNGSFQIVYEGRCPPGPEVRCY